jgi:hypothetical protein
MAKGNRKRSKKTEPTKKKVENKKKQVSKTPREMFPVRTLSQADADRLKELFTLSNNFAALLTDYNKKEQAIKSMRDVAKDILKEKEPLLQKISQNLYRPLKDYKKVSSQIKEQADSLEKAQKLVVGQLKHRYEEYVDAVIRLHRFLGLIIQTANTSTISGHRTDEKTRQEEKVLFEKDFDKEVELTEDEVKQLEKIQKDIKKKQDAHKKAKGNKK